MKKNIVLFSNEFETAVVYDRATKKFRYYLANPLKNCIGGRAIILPTHSVIETLGGIDKADMYFGYDIKLKKDINGYYYEFSRVDKRPLSEYFLFTDNVYLNKQLQPIGSAVGYRYQYEENFNCK